MLRPRLMYLVHALKAPEGLWPFVPGEIIIIIIIIIVIIIIIIIIIIFNIYIAHFL